MPGVKTAFFRERLQNTMKSRERVIRSLEFRRPDRAPRDLGVLPYHHLFQAEALRELLARYPIDIGRAELSEGDSAAELKKYAAAGQYTDEWGSVWEIGEPGVIGEVKQPALSNWSGLEHYQPPWATVRGRNPAYVNRLCQASEQFMLSGVAGRPFERLQFLRGTENTFIDLAYDTPQIRTLINMIHEYYLEDVRFWASTAVDAVVFMDDWGSNQSLLIDPQMWRTVFKPLYRDYCDIIHGQGKYVFFHSDGNIASIYGDLIEIGINAVNSQLFVMDIEGLAKNHKGKITFWGEIDRQNILPFGSPQDVRQAVRRVRNALDNGSGGVIAQCEWGKDNPQQNIEAVFKTWEEQRGQIL
jgi:uroporphyrinogen decarboxylase